MIPFSYIICTNYGLWRLAWNIFKINTEVHVKSSFVYQLPRKFYCLRNFSFVEHKYWWSPSWYTRFHMWSVSSTWKTWQRGQPGRRVPPASDRGSRWNNELPSPVTMRGAENSFIQKRSPHACNLPCSPGPCLPSRSNLTTILLKLNIWQCEKITRFLFISENNIIWKHK